MTQTPTSSARQQLVLTAALWLHDELKNAYALNGAATTLADDARGAARLAQDHARDGATHLALNEQARGLRARQDLALLLRGFAGGRGLPGPEVGAELRGRAGVGAERADLLMLDRDAAHLLAQWLIDGAPDWRALDTAADGDHRP